MKDFSRNAVHIRKMVDQANQECAVTPTNYTRFHYFSETNQKGLFLFGVYDYVTKKHELVDVFNTDLGTKIKRMEEILQI